MTTEKPEALTQFAKECGAVTYTNRHMPGEPAVAFGNEAWAKFCAEVQRLSAPQGVDEEAMRLAQALNNRQDCEDDAADCIRRLAAENAALRAASAPAVPTIERAYEVGAKGAAPTEFERLLFEAWMRGHCWAVVGEWNGSQYVHPDESAGIVDFNTVMTNRLFAAWRDRASLAASPAAPAPQPSLDVERERRDFQAYCRKNDVPPYSMEGKARYEGWLARASLGGKHG